MTTKSDPGILYEPDERAPVPLAFGLGLQLALLTVAIPILFPTVVMRAAGASESHVLWAVFAALAICGVTTVTQALRFGRIGGGYVLVMGSSAAFIGVAITAVSEGGPATFATLVVVSGLFQLLLSARLALFRRILTPTVSGTILMLLPVTIISIVFDMLTEVPDGSPTHAAPLSALATLFVVSGITLKARGSLRLWAPIVGVVAGSAVAAFFGLYEVVGIGAASWVGFPEAQWPGLDLQFGSTFWALLPAFLLVAMVGTVRTVSSAVAIQRVSWRERRALDFRAVQGALNVDGIGNLMCGVAGTVPNTTYSAGSAALAELTGVGARGVGVATGIVFVALAFFPKALATVLAIPGPVVAAYLTILIAMLFVIGVKIVVQDGLDYRKGLIVGVAFWVGVGFQYDMIFPEHVVEFAGGLFRNGMTAGGLAAIVLNLLLEMTKSRGVRMETDFSLSALPKIGDFFRDFASRRGWDDAMSERLDAAAEETLLTLLQLRESEPEQRRRRLRLLAYEEEGGAVLEFVVASGGENLEDRVALLGEQADESPGEREVSLRLLRHLATSVRHQQYHDTDIVTLRVNAPG